MDYQGGGTYKRKYRVREIIPKGAFEITFKNEQVGTAIEDSSNSCLLDLVLLYNPKHAVLQSLLLRFVLGTMIKQRLC